APSTEAGGAGATADEVLRLAAGAEQPSEHPLARMLVAEARRRGIVLPTVDDFQAQPGAGVQARLRPAGSDGPVLTVLIGNPRLVREQGVAIPPDAESTLAAL